MSKWPIHPTVRGMKLSSAAKRHLQHVEDTVVARLRTKLAASNDETKALKKQLKTTAQNLRKAKATLKEDKALIEMQKKDLERASATFNDITGSLLRCQTRLHLAEGILGPEGREALYEAGEAHKAEIARAQALESEEE